jgi:hypothetical protein
VLTWLSSRIADLATEGVLTQHELQEGLRRVDEMVGAFNGTAQTSTLITLTLTVALALTPAPTYDSTLNLRA